MIHKNCFEIIDINLYINHIKNLRKGFSIRRLKNIKYILHAYSFKNGLSRNNFIYQNDYYYVDNNMNIIMYNDDGYGGGYRQNVWAINHNTIKYLLINNIIRIVDAPSMAKINLLYK